jgi:hypothetical protein
MTRQAKNLETRRVSPWPPEIVARLRVLNDGRSMSQVAHTLNREFGLSLTRNAVSGKVFRMDLDWVTRPGRKSLVLKSSAPARMSKPKRPSVPRAVVGGMIATAAFKPLAGAQGVSFMDMRPRMCRWPIRDDKNGVADLFCGAPAERGRHFCYCPTHQLINQGRGTSREARAAETMTREMKKERKVK